MAMSISMSSSMELLPVFTSASFSSSSTFSLCRYLFPPLVFSFHGLRFSPQRPPRAWTDASRTRSFRISAMGNGEVGEKGAFLEGSSGVLAEVIGMGSRKDAVLDFCLDSPFRLSSSLRFWSINTEDSTNVQLQERFLGKDLSPRSAEASLFLQSCSKTIILVVNAGFGLDFLTATDILRTIRSRNGLAVVVVLKPFSFEGQRRQDEVKDFVGKIQEHTNFLIDIDTDTLLKKDLVTLDEALKMANTAVLLAINAISVLMSEMRWKVIDKLHNVKEIKGLEVINILESQKEAKVGYGAGNSIKSSILQALFDCPFIGGGVQDLNGTIISIMASSGPIEESDVYASLRAFSQSSEFKGQIIVSTVLEPNLESNMVVSTIIAVGCVELQASQKNTILSRLAQHFPFLFNLLKRNHQESCDPGGNKVLKDDRLSKVTNSPVPSAIERIALVGTSEGHDELHNVLEATSSIKSDDRYDLRNHNGGAEENGNHLLAAKTESSNLYNQISEETPAFQREPLGRWNLGPGYQVAKEWAQERAGTSPMLDNLSIFSLPIGVRPTEELEDYLNISHATENVELKIKDVVKEQTLGDSNISSWGAFTDAGFLAVKDFYNNAYTLLKGRNTDLPKKQGGLSVRAASMLEAERDSPKQWSPNTEMQYRGGVYRGRCQGGLPEGKGQLVLGDGSIYDGMWHYGRRSGLGTLYFCNGDMFQGSWRDDVMHGKGWFYFHTGDRWFANFWKGKANGESRFYSESGDVFFGHFQDGWRHGEFLCIDVGGARWIEIWNKGVLVSRKELDS